jgi:CrcB protein
LLFSRVAASALLRALHLHPGLANGGEGAFRLGTFTVNVFGSFLIGLLMTLMAERFMENPEWRLLLVVGGLGGFTTFSTFQYETGKLAADGELIYAALNIILSVIAGFTALKLGEVIAKSI